MAVLVVAVHAKCIQTSYLLFKPVVVSSSTSRRVVGGGVTLLSHMRLLLFACFVVACRRTSTGPGTCV